ncbi:MAG: hypothetical protein QOE76_579 [Frankiales bacterium]|jgi:hypothetical protein|nr:hypothetical protein [Frankiales bacterium]
MLARAVRDALVRCRVNRPSPIDRRTGEVVRRSEHDSAGSLIHVDVKKLGKTPDGGVWAQCPGLETRRPISLLDGWDWAARHLGTNG